MHLRRRQQDQQSDYTQQPYVQKAKRVENSNIEPAFNWDRSLFPKEVHDLAAARKNLQRKIREIENRLRFGYSEALNNYKTQLVKEDVELCCKMTNHLIVLKKSNMK